MVFGNIFQRKRRLIRRLEGVAHRLTSQPFVELERAQNFLWGEYEQVLEQEEVFWFQKSRSKWLLCGDKNTRFFHGVTTIKRRKSTFDFLQDNEGNWVGDQGSLEQLVTSYFKELFTEEPVIEASCIAGAFPSLSSEELLSFERMVTRSDVLM